nr:PDR ABC-type transporter family protein [Tanacetum cinerariifolium]
MARRRKRLGAGESRPGESRPTKSRPTESRPTESRLTKSTPTESRPRKHFVWDPETETRVRKAWDAKASGRYADFFRDIRAKMVKPIFMSDSAWKNSTSHWGTSKYKEIQEKIHKIV